MIFNKFLSILSISHVDMNNDLLLGETSDKLQLLFVSYPFTIGRFDIDTINFMLLHNSFSHTPAILYKPNKVRLYFLLATVPFLVSNFNI